MEDYLHFTETFSNYILMPDGNGRDMLHVPELRQMWTHLQVFVKHHFRAQAGHLCGTPEGLAAQLQEQEQAQHALRQFSVMAEQLFEGHPLCTFNLHTLNCRLAVQQKVRGHTSFYGEWWVESLVQELKSTVRGRSTRTPEPAAVNDMAMRQALQAAKAAHPNLRTVDEWVSSWDTGAMRGKNLDPGVSGLGLLGSGRALLVRTELPEARKALSVHVRDFQPVGWSQHHVEDASFLLYQYAYKGATAEDPSLIIQSKAYLRARSRVSCYALVRIEEGDELVTYVAHVLYFLLCTPQPTSSLSTPIPPQLRLAIADLYRVHASSTGDSPTPGVQPVLYKVTNLGSPLRQHRAYPLDLEYIQRKVVYMGEVGNKVGHFGTYEVVSNTVE